jgi:parallel beta-helix repeat protein
MKRGIFCSLICLLMIFTTVVPLSASTSLKKTSQPLMMGKTLYVGGLGPNNYTKIQDAIDDASDDDMIFVYHDSSPYYENLLVNKSVMLIGEDRQTTVIDGKEQGSGLADVLHISADGVTVQGFTIQNGSIEGGPQTNHHCGIEIRSDNNIIKDNIIVDNYFGIQLGGLTDTLRRDWSKNNVIEGNLIMNNKGAGIHGMFDHNNSILGNNVSWNHFGILLDYDGWRNLFSSNVLFSNDVGIFMAEETDSTVRQNIITENKMGVEVWDSNRYTITENNIFNNDKNAAITAGSIGLLWHWRSNVWDRNYWGGSTQRPVAIIGTCELVVMNILLVNVIGLQPQHAYSFPFFKLDRNPAQEPYDIPGMR